jgi:hypothetical protein
MEPIWLMLGLVVGGAVGAWVMSKLNRTRRA